MKLKDDMGDDSSILIVMTKGKPDKERRIAVKKDFVGMVL